ncbi:transposase [Salmonella enterica subsp. VII serovar 1,40:g,z51:--]|nr:transposase [Salmonella enterica subsp. VII str. CFSAN000550]EDT6886273.1 transposase [Salmonella enterica subsp. enterica]EDU6368502.1 transposase [Salmonella enterica subsp. houtenae serovar 40:z4,z24:-]EDU7899831.1 transposase [Salmonella enterica subsp. houtenae]EEO7412365.1 transposase [Salmonella enterica]QJY66723.1 transposase [Salmonella enterica subsp. VII serovar 1,40:g,z51:--]
MTEPTARRKRASYPMSFKIDLVQQSLQPGASVARLAREHGINDNLLFTWRQRYRHLVDAPVDDGAGETGALTDNIVPVVLKRQLLLLSAAPPAAVPASPPGSEQTCEIVIGRARLKLSGHLTPAMLATLLRELKRGRR